MDRDFDGRLSFEEFMGEVKPDANTNTICIGTCSVYYWYLIEIYGQCWEVYKRVTEIEMQQEYNYKYHYSEFPNGSGL